MFRAIKILAAIAVVSLAAGCAGPLPKVEASPVALAKVKSLAVIRTKEPQEFTYMGFGHAGVGAVFGLVGGLVAAGIEADERRALNLAIKARNPSPTSTVLADAIALQLKQRGFDARVEDGNWIDDKGGYKIESENIQSDADAVLIVLPTWVGFVSEGITKDFLPTMRVSATLLGKDRNEILYRGFHATGWKPNSDDWKYSSPMKTYSSIHALMANPGDTASSLSEAARQIAKSVAGDLKRD